MERDAESPALDQPYRHTGEIVPALAFAHAFPDAFGSLSETAQALLLWEPDFWLRPEQRIPKYQWRMFGLDGGRGLGKSFCLATYVNDRVERGIERHVALMAPTIDRVDEVQIKSLIDYAPPWFRPERYRGGLIWPNGVEAVVFTPEAPERSRSENISLSWMCEIVDWNPSTMRDAYDSLSTATRIGEARIIWDSTNKGHNELLALFREQNKSDPRMYPIVGGTMFDNPLLSRMYLQSEHAKYSGVRRLEEIYGRNFDQADGALWQQAWIDRNRVDATPAFDWMITAVDPATSTYGTADETGIIECGHGRADGHAYLTADLSGKFPPEQWGELAIRKHLKGGRITIERKKIGDNAVYVIRSCAATHGLTVEVIGRDAPWPPPQPQVIHVREQSPQDSKGSRAEGPATETDANRVHHVGQFPDLEKEMTTYVPGTRMRSPNRLDAAAYAIAEVRGLAMAPAPDGRSAVADAVAANAHLKRTAPDPRERKLDTGRGMSLIVRRHRFGL